MLKFKILIIFWLSCNLVFAQKLVFKVIAITGDAKTQEQKLKVGIELFDNQEITIQENTYLALIHPSGRTLELAKAGSYPIKNLEDLLLKNENPHLTIFKSKQRPKIYRYLNGTVERPFAMETVFLPNSSKIYQIQKNPIAWEKSISNSKSITYKVNVLDDYDEIINQTILVDTNFVLDLALIASKPDDIIFVKVEMKDKKYSYDGKKAINFLNKV